MCRHTITDAEDISPQYAEAAEVLTGMGIINGYEDDSFQPQNSIKRSEVAAMIYRAATSDVEDNKVDIVADSDLFTDVNPDDWYALRGRLLPCREPGDRLRSACHDPARCGL